MVICGCGFGVGYFPMLKASWSYFPEKKGLISGIVLCCIGFSSLIFTSLADFIINPEGKSPVNDYFEYEIAIKTKDFIFLMIIIISCFGIISNCLVFPYSEEVETVVEVTQMKPDQNERVNEVLRVKEFYLLGIMGIGLNFLGAMITYTNRTFGSINHIDESLLQMISKVFGLLNGSTRILWGFLYDKVNFKILYSSIIINFLLCSFSYYFCGQNQIAFFLVNCLVCLSFSGQNTLFNPTIIHYFGIKNSAIIAGMYNLINGITVLINPILCKFVVKAKEDFLIVYFIGGGFALISFIAFMIMKKESYVYAQVDRSQQDQIDKSEQKLDERISTTTDLLINNTSGGHTN